MSRHSFDPEIAEVVGLNAAVIYQNIVWWCEKNAANERNVYEGKAWTYNTLDAFCNLFPYLSAKQIRTALNKLKDAGLVAVGNFNKDPRDRTIWYAPEGKCHLPKRAERCAQKGRALPDSKPDKKPDGKHSPPTPQGGRACETEAEPDLLSLPAAQGKTTVPKEAQPPQAKRQPKIAGGLREGCDTLEAEFEQIWPHFPRKVGKGNARKAWIKARRTATFDEIAKPLGLFIRNQRNVEQRFIPHLSTWLNGERWQDDQTHATNRAATSSDRLDRLGAADGGSPALAGPRTLPELEWRPEQ